jgi:hypothetical protein
MATQNSKKKSPSKPDARLAERLFPPEPEVPGEVVPRLTDTPETTARLARVRFEALAELEKLIYPHVFDAIDLRKMLSIEERLWIEIDRQCEQRAFGDFDNDAFEIMGELASELIARALRKYTRDPRRWVSLEPSPDDLDEDCELCRILAEEHAQKRT